MAYKEYTLAEVAKHHMPGDLWLAIDGKVYDVSQFANAHPGGANILHRASGKDVTKAFFALHRAEILFKPKTKGFQIGTVVGQTPKVKEPVPGQVSHVPYAEPMGLSPEFYSPYYHDGHRRFHQAVRKFLTEEVLPVAVQSEASGAEISRELIDKLSATNIIAMRVGPGQHLRGRVLMGGIIRPEEYDRFHELILHLEIARLGTRGFVDGMLSGNVVGLPPILNYGSPELQSRIVPEVLGGQKCVALAITEAFAGSDVKGVKTLAVKDGYEWVVTGTKKWVTNGTFANYFVTLCQTDHGPTVFVIPRTDKVSTRPIKTSYSATAGTAYVCFDGARVSEYYMLGKVGQGLQVVYRNFNHDRWVVAATSLGAQRLIVGECIQFANQRNAYGGTLNDQAVVRAKLALVIERVEACQSWMENITHQMNHMSFEEQSDKLAGPIALLKKFITRSGRENAEDATQIFGGRSITVTGMGKNIENFQRTSAFDAILSGAEDVLGDLGVRQAMRKIPQDTRL